MSLIIDTGTPLQTGAIGYVSDWMRDQCPADYADWQVVQAYTHHIIGDMKRPKKLETVIDHLLFNWRFLGELGRENPALFLEIWTAFSERIDGQ